MFRPVLVCTVRAGGRPGFSGEKIRVGGARLPVLARDDPVGKAAIADFAVAPRAASKDDFQANLPAFPQE